jgi:hypothetical protein
MDAAVSTGLFTVGGTIAGTLSTLYVQRSSGRATRRERSRELLGQVVSAAGALQMENLTYLFRRSSRRANAMATGLVLLELGASRLDGNWVRGAATAIRELREWDMTEAARFQDRFQAASAEMGPALLYLSLMSPALRLAASHVSDALRDGMSATKVQDAKTADDRIDTAIDELSNAVRTFTSSRRERRRSA